MIMIPVIESHHMSKVVINFLDKMISDLHRRGDKNSGE